jgi:hypothetical protein
MDVPFVFARRSPASIKGTELLAKGTELLAKGTELLAKGTELLAKGTELLAKGTELLALGTRLRLPLQDASALFLFALGLLGESPLALGFSARRLLTFPLLLPCPLRVGDDDETDDHIIELPSRRARSPSPSLAGTAADPLVDLEAELARGRVVPLWSEAPALLDPLVERDRQPLSRRPRISTCVRSRESLSDQCGAESLKFSRGRQNGLINRDHWQIGGEDGAERLHDHHADRTQRRARDEGLRSAALRWDPCHHRER